MRNKLKFTAGQWFTNILAVVVAVSIIWTEPFLSILLAIGTAVYVLSCIGKGCNAGPRENPTAYVTKR